MWHDSAISGGLQDRVQELAQQLAASQAEAEAAREAAEAGQAMASEMQRLAEDNALLASRTRQMEIDLQVRHAGCYAAASCLSKSACPAKQGREGTLYERAGGMFCFR